MVNPYRTFAFIGGHLPYSKCLGFVRSDKKVLQGSDLVVPFLFLSFCYSDLQLSNLVLTFGKSISFHVLLCLAEDVHSAFALLLCCFFISFEFYNRFTKNYPAEVCLLSHEVTFKPLSSA